MDVQQPAVGVAPGEQAGGAQGAEKPRTVTLAPWLAWTACVLSMALVVATLVLTHLNEPDRDAGDLVFEVVGVAVLLAYATVGAVIASRRPDNPIGWLFLAAPLFAGLGVFADEYTRYALVTSPGSLPGGGVTAALTAWPQDIGFSIMFTFVFLLFPDGRLLSPRWRAAALLAVTMILVLVVRDAFKPGTLQNAQGVKNPLGIEGIDGFFDFLSAIGDVLILATVAVCAASVIVRFRRARGEERQQMKWFAYAAIITLSVFAAQALLGFTKLNISQTALDILLILSLLPFPIATGIAILKYRLYDIDLIINRTLVYVPLTAILAGVFAASTALFQKLFMAITGQQSDAVVAITTLILVASITPLKNGLQSVVDKRFKEAPDPTKKLRAFGDQVGSFVQLSSAEQLTQRLLDEATSAFQSTGGVICMERPGQLQLVYASGKWTGDAQLSVPFQANGVELGNISLGPRSNGLDYTPADRDTLQETVDLVAQAIALSERSSTPA
jgi:hypothetical protein